MRQQIAAPLLLIVCAMAYAAPAPPSTQQSTDGTSYGECGEQKVKPERLPLVGLALGNPPVILTQNRPTFAAGTDKAQELIKASKIRHLMPIKYPSQFYTHGGLGNSALTGFDVDCGRVVAVTLYYMEERGRPDERSLNVDKAELKQLRERSPASVILSTPDEHDVMTFEYNPIDWYVLNHHPKPEIATAMEQHKPIVGMTEQEAQATLFALHQLESSENAGAKTIVYGRYDLIPPQTVDGQTSGTGTVRKVPLWQVTYSGGKVVEVTKY